MKRYVIIGNGTAAAGCIEGIRSADAEGSITVISAENHPVYCRPLISYYLEKKTDLRRMNYRADSFYADNHADVRYGIQASGIDADAKEIMLDNGEKLPYDALCVCTGSAPFIPPMQGLETVQNKFPFMTIDDALALEKAVTPESRVLIIGAGLIGLKCAEGLHGRVQQITVCDLAPRVLSSILDDKCAAMMQKHLEANGIRFLLGTSAQSFSGNSAVMQSGETVDFDVLVLAVGVRAGKRAASTCRSRRVCRHGAAEAYGHTSFIILPPLARCCIVCGSAFPSDKNHPFDAGSKGWFLEISIRVFWPFLPGTRGRSRSARPRNPGPCRRGRRGLRGWSRSCRSAPP